MHQRPPASRAAAALRALVGGGLLGTAHVALSLVWGLVVGTAVWTLLVVGVSGLAAFGLGALALLGAAALARALGVVERARLAGVLGAAVTPPPALPGGTPWHRVRQLLASGATWLALAWLLLLPVLATVWTTVVVTLWSVAGALLSLPLWVGGISAGGWLATGARLLDGPLGGVAAVVLGLALVALALLTARGCAAVDVALARALLGASSAEQTRALTARVQTLTDTRAGVVDTADAERRRIERDLHDGAQQRLVALAVDLGMASAKMDDDPEAAKVLVRRAHAEAKAALVELRDLARGIHPAVLTDRGLDAALSALAARSPVPVTVAVDLPDGGAGRCSPTVEATAYFVVAEALTNVARHSGAARASVTVHRRGSTLVVEVADDGTGGAAGTPPTGAATGTPPTGAATGTPPTGAATGTGLAGLRSRVAGVDGAMHLSSPPGGPTLLRVELPCTP